MSEASGKYLVTGVSSGIGASIATRLLEAGHEVTGIDIAPAPPALAGRIGMIEADLLDLASLQDLTGRIAPEGWAGFVHCAGLMRGYPIGEETAERAEELFRLHVAAAVTIGNIILPGMGPGGRVLFFASRAMYGRPARALYAASKSALVGLARCWALEVASRGITVNIIAPGPVDTPMLRDPARAAVPAVTAATVPIGRIIQPEEVAAVAMFLISADAGAITGQIINVCGGGSLVAGI